MEEQQPKLTLEQYAGFFLNPERRGLSLDLLNQIVKMHGFSRFRTKKALLPAFRAVAMMSPTRSTLRRGCAGPCAALGLDEVRRDVAAIGWAECPLGSVRTVGSSSPGAAAASVSSAEPIRSSVAVAEKTKKKKKRQRTVAISSCGDLSRPMPAAEINNLNKNKKKKKRSKKKKRALGTPPAPLLLIEGCPPGWGPRGK